MSGWLYIIRNGDLYKIGITRNFDNRMRQLKPDKVISKLYTTNFKQLEKDFHRKYQDVRIPQSEYFRLSDLQLKEIKHIISDLNYPMRITIGLFINSLLLLLVIFIFVLLLKFLTINNVKNVTTSSLLLMERIAFGLSLFSLFLKSDKYFNLVNEIKFRCSRCFILTLLSFLFAVASRIYFEN